MKSLIYFIFGGLLWILINSTVTGQTTTLYLDEQIRITSSKYFIQKTEGRLVGLQNDTLIFESLYGRQYRIPIQNLKSLEVAREEKSNTKEGALIGGTVTGLALGLLAAIDVSDDQDGWFTPTPGQAFVGGLISGGLIGSLTGAIIGSGIRTFRWVEVPLEAISVKEKPAVLPAWPEARQMQPIGQRYTMPRRRWSVSVTLGTNSSGPAGEIEQAMRRDGWDETSPGGWFGGSVDHPFSRTGFGEIGAPWTMEVSYDLKRHLHLAMLLTRTPMGESIGYHRNPAVFLSARYDVTTVSPIFILTPGGIIRVGFGPAWFITEMEGESNGGIVYHERRSQPGAVLLASLLYPRQKRFFTKLDVQYRWTPEETFGPITTYAGFDDVAMTLNEFKTNYSHTYIGFGLGMHF